MKRVGIALLAAVIAAGCSRRQEPPPPAPEQQLPDTAGQGQRALDAARADSIQRANEARAAAEAAAARARDILTQRVHFDYDESRIRSDAEQVLRSKLDVMRANPGVALEITGHADERGSIEYNLALGLRRANAVREYMIGFGIDPSRLTTETAGEDQPLVMGSNESAWAQNRRAEFRILRGGENLVMPGT